MVKIGVLVSGGGTNLQALLDAQDQGRLHSGQIALVVSSRAGAYALERAKQHGVESATLARRASTSSSGLSRTWISMGSMPLPSCLSNPTLHSGAAGPLCGPPPSPLLGKSIPI